MEQILGIKQKERENHVGKVILQIVLMIVNIFSVSYFIYASTELTAITYDPYLDTFQKSQELQKFFLRAIVHQFDLLPSVSAQETTSYSANTTTSINANCCLKTNDGAVCQTIAAFNAPTACPADKIVPASCDQVAECKMGCCQDTVEGLCSTRAPKGLCESQGGEWSNDINCNIPSCELGCCMLGNNAQFVNEQRCNQLSVLYGFEKDYRQVGGELECLALAPEIALGSCIVGDSCRFGSTQECVALNGQFYRDKFCSNPVLNTSCQKQARVGCIEGKDEIYWFDSCGNRENIYDANKDRSWNNGQVLGKNDSCNPKSNNADSKTCGNCNRFLGSFCSASEQVNNQTKQVQDGPFVCKDLSCIDEQGKNRKNGESWCVYDGTIGDGKDVVGSRHWKRICQDGNVEVEPCADYRGQICVESSLENQGKKFSSAACVINPALECVNYNQDKDTIEQKCKENAYCQLTKINVDKGFEFSICTAKYPIGFDLTGEDKRSSDSANLLCGMANQKCTVLYEKKLSGWTCIFNCACETKKFSKEMNNLCVGLGDCGSYVNIVGEGTNNIKVTNAPAISWQEYVKYATPVDGQKAEPEPLSATLRKLGLGGKAAEAGGIFSDSAAAGKFLGYAVGGMGPLATEAMALGLLSPTALSAHGAAIGLDITVAQALASEGATGLVASSTAANFAGATIGFSLGTIAATILTKAFGLQGDAALIMSVAGVVAGTVIAVITYSAVATAVAGKGLIAGTLIGFKTAFLACIANPLCLVVLIILIVIAIVLKILGIGKTKKVIVQFSCLPWQAPSGGRKCEECNKDPLKPCTAYRCGSLGAACQLINVESTNPVCVTTQNDGKSPLIVPNETSAGFQFLNPTIRGVEIRALQGQCIPEFELLTFTLSTDERAQCVYDLQSGIQFEDFSEFVLEGTSYTKDHSFGFIAPSIASLQNLTEAEITGDIKQQLAHLNMYVRCKDVHGNENTQNYLIDLCIASGPDLTAPKILATTPVNSAFLKQDVSKIPLTLSLNEPAECKYDTQGGKSYENMSIAMVCNTDLNDPGLLGWECNTTLIGLANNDNTFYIKCHDQPWYKDTNESARNTNTEDYVYILHGTQNALQIMNIQPQGTVSGGVEPFSLRLTADTAGGISEGKTACSYSFIDYNKPIQFFNTFATHHEQVFNLLQGDYNIYILCKDDAGNTDLGNATFTLSLDTQPPQAIRIYKERSSIKMITNEQAQCFYSTEKCNFNFENGTLMTTAFSIQHSAPFETGRTLYIRCKDLFNNAPNGCTIELIPTQLT